MTTMIGAWATAARFWPFARKRRQLARCREAALCWNPCTAGIAARPHAAGIVALPALCLATGGRGAWLSRTTPSRPPSREPNGPTRARPSVGRRLLGGTGHRCASGKVYGKFACSLCSGLCLQFYHEQTPMGKKLMP